MEKAAHEIPIVYARNMSIGVNVFMELVARAAKALGDGYDVEIAETHHRHKVDAPSGTALALGERVAAARGRKLEDLAVYARQGQTGPRVPGTIGFSVVRGGNVVGEHAVRFIGAEEEVEFSHRAARSQDVRARRVARGALGGGPGAGPVLDGRRARTLARLRALETKFGRIGERRKSVDRRERSSYNCRLSFPVR